MVASPTPTPGQERTGPSIDRTHSLEKAPGGASRTEGALMLGFG